MKYIVFIFLFISFASYGQSSLPLGSSNPAINNKIKGSLEVDNNVKFPNLPAADENDAFLMMHSDGTVGYGNDQNFFKLASDSTGNGGYGTRRWVDSLVSATSGTVIDSAYFASKHYADSINALNTLQVVTDRDSVTTHKITATKFLANGTTDSGSPDAGIKTTGTITSNSGSHAFRDERVIGGSSTTGFNSYDAAAKVSSSISADFTNTHIVAFQDRIKAENSSNLGIQYGFYSEQSRNNGHTDSFFCFESSKMGGTGTVSVGYGYHAREMGSNVGLRFAFRSEGDGFSSFQGKTAIGLTSRLDTPVEMLDVRGNGRFTNDIKFYHNSNTGTLTTTTLTGSRTYTLQDASGTIAFTSDITSTDTSSLSTRIDARIKYTDTSASWFATRNYVATNYAPISGSANYLWNGLSTQLNAKLVLGVAPADTFTPLVVNKMTDNPSWAVSSSGTKNTLDLFGNTGTYIRVAYASNTNNGNYLQVFRALGSNASPSAITNNSHLFAIDVYGYDGTASREVGWLYWRATENWNSTSRGNKVIIGHNINGTTTLRDAFVAQGTGVISLNPTNVAQPVVIGGSASSATGASLEVNGGIYSLSGTVTAQKLAIAAGTNKAIDVAALSGGTVTVNNTSVTASSRIFVTGQSCSNCGAYYVTSIVAGTSFVINSTNASDASTVAYWIMN